ncbi:MAG: glycosyltransferase family 4 protein [Anaerolineaceae bacterium]|nr:glycosyltransferase family 4 protein [Anaerolineaceae bacterium]
MKTPGSICFLPKLEGLGGPASFQARLMAEFRSRGIAVHHDPTASDCTAILLSGGTRHLVALWQAKRRGVRIVQRLAQMNWIHHVHRTGLHHYLRSERNNRLLAFIRHNLADRVVYQSDFVEDMWTTAFGRVSAPGVVIHNGVDLQAYTPQGPHQRPVDHLRLLVVEGHLGGGNEPHLKNAIRLAQALESKVDQRVELMIAGDAPQSLQDHWNEKSRLWLTWLGAVPRQRVPEIDRSAHFLYSSELNAGCPNAVIEALACGLPVVGYATGALPELVPGQAGRVVPYGSDHWKLEPPDTPALAAAALEVLADQEAFRRGARAHAEAQFAVSRMADSYLDVLLG